MTRGFFKWAGKYLRREQRLYSVYSLDRGYTRLNTGESGFDWLRDYGPLWEPGSLAFWLEPTTEAELAAWMAKYRPTTKHSPYNPYSNMARRPTSYSSYANTGLLSLGTALANRFF